MKTFEIFLIIITCIGAINWGLVAAFKFNLVESLFGANSALEKLTYALVGISGIALLTIKVFSLIQH